MRLRSCKVAIVAVIGPLTMLHLDFFLILVEAAAHARATSIFPSLCPISSAKLIEWKQDSWVSALSKKEV